MKNNMNSRFLSFVTALSLIFIPARSAWPQGTIYFERTAFSNACRSVSGNKQSISFEYLPGYGEFGPILTAFDMIFRGGYLVRQSPTSLYNFDSDFPLTIHFNSGALAFGADFSSKLSPQFTSFTATVSLDWGATFNFTAPSYPDSQFFGFISPTPIVDLTFSDGAIFMSGGYPMHQEVIGNIYEVLLIPEPSELGLLALGGLLLGGRFRRRGMP